MPIATVQLQTYPLYDNDTRDILNQDLPQDHSEMCFAVSDFFRMDMETKSVSALNQPTGWIGTGMEISWINLDGAPRSLLRQASPAYIMAMQSGGVRAWARDQILAMAPLKLDPPTYHLVCFPWGSVLLNHAGAIDLVIDAKRQNLTDINSHALNLNMRVAIDSLVSNHVRLMGIHLAQRFLNAVVDGYREDARKSGSGLALWVKDLSIRTLPF